MIIFVSDVNEYLYRTQTNKANKTKLTMVLGGWVGTVTFGTATRGMAKLLPTKLLWCTKCNDPPTSVPIIILL